MNIHDQKTQTVAEAVKEVLAEKKKIKETEYLSQRDQDAKDAHDVDVKDYPAKKKKNEAKSENLAEYDFEEGNEFTAAAAKAKLAGKDEFEFDGKTYPTEISQDAAEKILGKKEEVELEEATELFKKGKITLTKFAMGKGKGVGLQINYGTKFIQVPEKDIKELYTAMVYVTKSVPQFKEEVELEEENDLDEALLEEAIDQLLEDESINIEEMSDEELDEMLEGILKKIGGAIKSRITTSGRADRAAKKADKMDKKAADREKLKKSKERIAKAKRQEKIRKQKERIAKQKKRDAKARLSKRNEGYAIEADAPENAEVEIHEAIKPEVFVKGGDTKVTKKDVDSILSKIFINTKLAKAAESHSAYKAGEKDAGKKKNPYKKDTADFHLYILGTQSAQAS